jgi:hypothetical protein
MPTERLPLGYTHGRHLCDSWGVMLCLGSVTTVGCAPCSEMIAGQTH